MSKSGSRYGRRSNWFKIHCLLQEQQQQAQAAVTQNGCHPKPPPSISPNSLNLMRHPSYSTSIFSRPPTCSKEEIMMLRLDEYARQHPAVVSSPSISSPDSHNSDSSIEIGEKRNSLKQPTQIVVNNKQLPKMPTQSNQEQSPLTLHKDMFLPLPFGNFPLMPPPGFLAPQTHFLLSSYHNAFYEQNFLQQQVQQSFFKTTEFSEKSQPRDETEKKPVKRHFSETLMEVAAAEVQRKHLSFSTSSLLSSQTTKIPKRSNHSDNEDDDQEDIDINTEISSSNLTPPRSPKSPMMMINGENNPIDLSTKSGSKNMNDINHNYFKAKINNSSDNFTVNENNSDNDSSSSIDHKEVNCKNIIHCQDLKDGYVESESHRNTFIDGKIDEYEIELKRRKLHLATPLDLTTKV